MKDEISTKIILGLVAVSAVAVGLYFLLRKKKECTEGDIKTRICPDTSIITTHTCVNGKWQATGITCPKLNVLVQYDSEEEADEASLIVNQLKTLYNITSIKYDAAGEQSLIDYFMQNNVSNFNIVVVLGANQANDIYDYLFPEITPDQEGCTIIKYKKWVLTDVYGVAGYSAIDTYNSAVRFINLAKNFQLPKQDSIVC